MTATQETKTKPMKHTSQVKITTIRRRLLRLQSVTATARCPICECAVATLAAAEAAQVLEVEAETLSRLIAAGQVHAIQTVSGSLRICQNSLFI